MKVINTDALMAMDRLRERGLDLEVDESHTPYRASAESSREMEVHRGEGIEVRVAPGVGSNRCRGSRFGPR